MKAEKTIVCRIVEPNKAKLEALKEEYNKVQRYIKGEDVDIYSATKQAMDKYIDKVKEGKEYPLHLRNDTFSVEKAEDTKEFDYWARIPVANTYGKIIVPIIPHQEIKEEYNIKDSKVVKREHGFELHLSVSKEVEPVEAYKGVLGVDLGLNKLATCVRLPGRQTHCYGTHVGDIQAKYYHLRRNCKNGYVRRKWDGKDKDKVEDVCHKISRKIVDTAKEKNLLIVLGDLEEIQEQDNGKEMNRKLHNFPHWKLRNYIKYKAKWEGIEVVEVSEAYTSQRCSRCGEIGDKHRGRFRCSDCGLEVDRDKNGAHNIAKRGIGKFIKASSDAGGHVAWPEATTVEATSGNSSIGETSCRGRW
ncbi:MAG: RNA-guided endonuclease InsQ/TnpB family protein [Candidatus Nanohaloarchaea archaeon]